MTIQSLEKGLVVLKSVQSLVSHDTLEPTGHGVLIILKTFG